MSAIWRTQSDQRTKLKVANISANETGILMPVNSLCKQSYTVCVLWCYSLLLSAGIFFHLPIN